MLVNSLQTKKDVKYDVIQYRSFFLLLLMIVAIALASQCGLRKTSSFIKISEVTDTNMPKK